MVYIKYITRCYVPYMGHNLNFCNYAPDKGHLFIKLRVSRYQVLQQDQVTQ